MTEEIIEKEAPPEEGVAEPVVNIVEEADKAAERLEAANKQYEKLIKRQEALKVEETLGGSSSAGAPSLTAEQRRKANARKYIEGSGFEDDLFPIE